MMFTYIKQLTQNTTVVDCVYGALEEADALQPTLRGKKIQLHFIPNLKNKNNLNSWFKMQPLKIGMRQIDRIN